MHNLYLTYFQKLIEGTVSMMPIMESTEISVTKSIMKSPFLKLTLEFLNVCKSNTLYQREF